MDTIGVVVPVYNTSIYLEQCISSILEQTYQDFILVLVDDGSTDCSLNICNQFSLKDERVVVVHKENGGLSSARNAGIDWLEKNAPSCRWITFIDSDDHIVPNCFDYMVRSALAIGAESVVAKIVHLKHGEQFDKDTEPLQNAVVYTAENAFIDNSVNTTSACCKLFLFSLFRDIRFPLGKVHEDCATIYQALFKANAVASISNELYVYTYNSEGITHSKWSLKYSLDNIEAVEGQLDYFERHGYENAWQVATMRYADLLITTLDCLKHKKAYRNEYVTIKRKLKKFIFQNRKKFKWKFTKFIFAFTYPCGKFLYSLKSLITDNILGKL